MPREEPVDLIAFSWRVPNGGYVWREDMRAQEFFGGKGKPPFLTVNNPSVSEYGDPKTLPFDEPGNEHLPLFEQFANLEPTPEAIKVFADANGWLGDGERVCPPGNEVQLVRGEPLERWRLEILAMKIAVTLWKWIRWRVGSVRVKRPSDHCVVVAIQVGDLRTWHEIPIYRDIYPAFRLFRKNENVLPAKTALVLYVNKKLAEVAFPGLLIDRHGQLQGFVRPRHLLGALWTQLYQAIQEWRRIRPCKYCHELMDVTGGRSTKCAHERCVRNHKMSRYRNKLAKRQNKETPSRKRTKERAH